MIDIPSHCETREKQLSAAGLHIADVLRAAQVDRASWTGWKHRGISPRMSTLQRIDDEIELALANPQAWARRAAQSSRKGK